MVCEPLGMERLAAEDVSDRVGAGTDPGVQLGERTLGVRRRDGIDPGGFATRRVQLVLRHWSRLRSASRKAFSAGNGWRIRDRRFRSRPLAVNPPQPPVEREGGITGVEDQHDGRGRDDDRREEEVSTTIGKPQDAPGSRICFHLATADTCSSEWRSGSTADVAHDLVPDKNLSRHARAPPWGSTTITGNRSSSQRSAWRTDRNDEFSERRRTAFMLREVE